MSFLLEEIDVDFLVLWDNLNTTIMISPEEIGHDLCDFIVV